MTFNLFGLLVDIEVSRKMKRGAHTWTLVVTTKHQDSRPYVRGLSLVWNSETARWHG